MMTGCENNVGWKMRIGLSVSVRSPGSVASSEIQRRGSCGSSAGEKNGLRSLWAESANFLRPQDPSSTRSLLWRHSGVPGVRGAARGLPELRRREAGASVVVGHQPLLYQTVRLLCGAALSGLDDPGCGSRTPPRLENGQGTGDGVHGRATPTGWDAWSEGVLGIDELSVGRGHNYRIIVSDLIRGRPIWFGGTDRSEKSMDLFFQWLGPSEMQGSNT